MLDSFEEDECDSQAKCESRSLHITCGYPAANPKSNLNAFCNELKHYIHCAKCKTINCIMEGSIISIKKHLINQEASYYDKCTISPLPSTTKLQIKSSLQTQYFNYYNEKTSQTRTTLSPITIPSRSSSTLTSTTPTRTITTTITTTTTTSIATSTTTATTTTTATMTSTTSTSTTTIQTTPRTTTAQIIDSNFTLPVETLTQKLYSSSNLTLKSDVE